MAGHPDDGVLFSLGAGHTVLVPPLVLYTVEKAWPAIEKLRGETSRIGEANSCLDIVVAALSLNEDSPKRDDLHKMLRTTHLQSFIDQTVELLNVSGLIPKGEVRAGAEVVAAAPAGPSMATAPASLPSSSATE